MKVNELSIGIKMQLIGIIDNNGNDVTQKYIDKEEYDDDNDDEKQKQESCINGLFKNHEKFNNIWTTELVAIMMDILVYQILHYNIYYLGYYYLSLYRSIFKKFR